MNVDILIYVDTLMNMEVNVEFRVGRKDQSYLFIGLVTFVQIEQSKSSSVYTKLLTCVPYPSHCLY